MPKGMHPVFAFHNSAEKYLQMHQISFSSQEILHLWVSGSIVGRRGAVAAKKGKGRYIAASALRGRSDFEARAKKVALV